MHLRGVLCSTSASAVKANGAAFFDAAVAGDVSCKNCLGTCMALASAQAAVKSASPVLTGAGGGALIRYHGKLRRGGK